MDEGLSQETWRRLREEAREATAIDRQLVEQWTGAALESDELALPARLELRLRKLSQDWAVHEKPLLTRVPLLGPFLRWLGAHLVRFLLQNQVILDAEIARILQEIHQAQRLLTEEQIERSDDLFSRLDERLLALEARLRDLESEVAHLREEQERSSDASRMGLPTPAGPHRDRRLQR